MEFCEKCGSMLVITTKEDGTRVLMCRSCGALKETVGEIRVTRRPKRKAQSGIPVIEDDSLPMPVTKSICPKCGNTEAYYWTVQTRRGDEGATEFYRCTKCRHTWRYYGG